MKNIRLRLFSFIVMGYMLLGSAWWSMLLYTKNKDAYLAKEELLATRQELIELLMSQRPELRVDLQHRHQELETIKADLKKSYKGQEWMILGEGLFLTIFLFFGIYLVDQGYRKEVASAKQRRNFLLSITHELKSPIASIHLILETFLKRNLEGEAIKNFSKSALKETQRLHNLVNDLLLSAKLEEAYQPHFEELDLSLLVHDLIAELEEKYPDSHFKVEENGSIPIVQADLSGVNSVLSNLLENAIKYSKGDADVTVRLKQELKYASVEIADQGVGIPDKEKKYVFEKFYRVGSEDTRSTKGTGLGLFIVKQIVKAHGGTIQVLDNQPKGTLMRLCLPLKQKENAEFVLQKA